MRAASAAPGNAHETAGVVRSKLEWALGLLATLLLTSLLIGVGLMEHFLGEK